MIFSEVGLTSLDMVNLMLSVEAELISKYLKSHYACQLPIDLNDKQLGHRTDERFLTIAVMFGIAFSNRRRRR